MNADNNDNYYMRIGEIAEFFGISQKAVRIYEKKGIIKPARIDEQTGYRYYTAGQVNQLNALIELKALGFTLAEIHRIMEGGITADKLQEALVKKKLAWQDTVSMAENKIDLIDRIAERLSSSNEAKGMHTMTEQERAWLLVKMVCVEDIKAQHTLSEAIWL